VRCSDGNEGASWQLSPTQPRAHHELPPAHLSAPPTIDDHPRLLALLHGPLRLVMAQRPFEGDLATTIAEPLDSDPSTVRGWVQRLNREGIAGLNDRPRSGRPRLAEPRAWKGSLSEQASMGCPKTRLDGVPSAPDPPRRHRAGPRASVTTRATNAGFLQLPGRVVTRWLGEHPRVRLILGLRSCPHHHPVERIRGAMRTYLATTPVETMAGRVRQV